MKKTIYAWVGKSKKLSDIMVWGILDILVLCERASRVKGNLSDWWPGDRPPRRVRITIEDVK